MKSLPQELLDLFDDLANAMFAANAGPLMLALQRLKHYTAQHPQYLHESVGGADTVEHFMREAEEIIDEMLQSPAPYERRGGLSGLEGPAGPRNFPNPQLPADVQEVIRAVRGASAHWDRGTLGSWHAALERAVRHINNRPDAERIYAMPVRLDTKGRGVLSVRAYLDASRENLQDGLRAQHEDKKGRGELSGLGDLGAYQWKKPRRVAGQDPRVHQAVERFWAASQAYARTIGNIEAMKNATVARQDAARAIADLLRSLSDAERARQLGLLTDDYSCRDAVEWALAQGGGMLNELRGLEAPPSRGGPLDPDVVSIGRTYWQFYKETAQAALSKDAALYARKRQTLARYEAALEKALRKLSRAEAERHITLLFPLPIQQKWRERVAGPSGLNELRGFPVGRR